MTMKKVLIIQEVLPHYRVPLFNEIGKDTHISLTIATEEKETFSNREDLSFGVVKYSSRKLGKFSEIKSLRRLIKGYDKVIMFCDLHWLPTLLKLLLFRGKANIFFWGIGISSERGLTKKPFMDKVRFLLSDFSSGTILYSKQISEYYISQVRKKQQIYVAANTIEVAKYPFPAEKRTKIISIGSFKKYKNLGNLILAFKQIIDKIPADITLDFVGNGEEEKKLTSLVKENGLENRVIFWGRKESDEDIYPIISRAIVSVSPTQAGLAVLHSMAFGCPFLTAEDAVTGGERFYIENNVNGYFYDGSIAALAEKLLWIIGHPEQNIQIAKNAYDFYHNECSIRNYSDSFRNIIHGVTT